MDRVAANAALLESEGVPFPMGPIQDRFDQAVQLPDLPKAEQIVRRAESLYERTARDWSWVRELLNRADEVRNLAAGIGVDVQHLDSRVGNPRAQLQTGLLSGGALERAAASASLALAVLNDAIPKYCVQEAANLGNSIRRAKARGADIAEAIRHFQRLLGAIEHGHATDMAQLFIETRKAVARIPPAPAVPAFGPEEEEEILSEARNLSRRLHQIKRRARDAQSAARLMSQVRAALSEDRRFGTPEEEIEELWNEVGRLTKERGFLVPEGTDVEIPQEEPQPEEDSEPREVPAAPSVSDRSRRARGGGGPAARP
jgi:hypothetical protein